MPDESLSVATPPAAKAPKETKAQRSERLKLAKNPWEAWDEVREFAMQGRESVLPEWSGLYFKWWGIYTQGDGIGVSALARGARPAGRACLSAFHHGSCRRGFRPLGAASGQASWDVAEALHPLTLAPTGWRRTPRV